MSRFNGDIALQPTLDGGQIEFSGGQPVMDAGGLENFVFISLFTSENWPGNALEENRAAYRIGSDFQELTKGNILTAQTLRDIEQSALLALQALIDIGAAQDITANVTAPDLNTVNIEIFIVKPDNMSQTIFYELNWISGFLQPVNAEVK